MRSIVKRHIVTSFRHLLLIAAFGAAIAASNAFPHAGNHDDETQLLVFGVVPQQSSAKLIRDWSPVLKKVSEISGLKIRFATAPNIPEFEKRLAAGEYDVAYMNPYHFTVYNQSPGYKAFAHAKGKRIKGILVVNKSSDIKSVSDLQGKNLAFPAPAAFAATLLTQATLKNQGILFTPHYVGSHDSAYLAVADGLFDGGGGIVRTLGAAPPEAKSKLRVLFTTEGFTPHAIATHPSVSEDARIRLQNAFVTLSDSNEGEMALKALNIKAFEQAEDKDWDDVRALQISVLNVD